MKARSLALWRFLALHLSFHAGQVSVALFVISTRISIIDISDITSVQGVRVHRTFSNICSWPSFFQPPTSIRHPPPDIKKPNINLPFPICIYKHYFFSFNL